mgnify:CR=1 FL=1
MQVGRRCLGGGINAVAGACVGDGRSTCMAATFRCTDNVPRYASIGDFSPSQARGASTGALVGVPAGRATNLHGSCRGSCCVPAQPCPPPGAAGMSCSWAAQNRPAPQIPLPPPAAMSHRAPQSLGGALHVRNKGIASGSQHVDATAVRTAARQRAVPRLSRITRQHHPCRFGRLCETHR